jgi:signal transduction histidine kinase
MNVLVQDLLEYGRISRVKLPLAEVNLLKTFEDALRDFGDAQRGSLSIDIPADMQVSANPQVLKQVLVNLLSNAFKFHAKGSTPDVRVWAELQDGVVKVNLHDNGIGIASEHQERIWQVFERLHDRDAYPGTGIGLAIVKRAVARMHGACGVESKLGEGSTFWIQLPKVSAQAQELAAEAAASEASASEGGPRA